MFDLWLNILAIIIIAFVSIAALKTNLSQRKTLANICVIAIIIASFFSIYSAIKNYKENLELKKLSYVINSIELIVTLSFSTITHNKEISTYRIALGKYNVSALRDLKDSLYYFNSDEILSTITTLKDSIRYYLVYKPTVENKLIGKNITFLEKIRFFDFKYTDYIKEWINKRKVDDSTIVTLKFLLKINGIKIDQKVFRNFLLSLKKPCSVDVRPLFDKVLDKYRNNAL